MESIDITKEFSSQIKESINTIFLQTNAKINELINCSTKIEEKLSILNAKLPLLVDVLNSLNLKMTILRYHKTGRNSEVWEENDQLLVGFNCISIDEKFEFLKHRGYTSKGHGKNNTALQAKAKKIEEKVKKATLIDKVEVNEYSLEEGKTKENNIVLFQIWL